MENRIVDIETYSHNTLHTSRWGGIRNSKKFALHQKVFIQSGDRFYQCEIVGVELPPVDNPDYSYKIEIPEGLIDPENNRISRKCDNIFESIEEARQVALSMLDHSYELNKERINKFFDSHEK